jgi:hypothetical protein
MRDGSWKLVRPVIEGTLDVYDIEWLEISMYRPEMLIESGLALGPLPQRRLPPAPPPELYDLASDPGEMRNVADLHPDRVRRMAAALEGWFADVDSERRRIDDVW